MSHIKNIEIKNFKSIKSARLEDCRRVNVLIGYPNVGKSNILEAMSLMSYINSSNSGIPYKHFCRFKKLIDIFFDGDKQNPIEINVDGFLLTLSFKSKDEIAFNLKDIDLSSRKVQITSPEGAAGLLSGVNMRYQIDSEGRVRTQSTDASYLYDKPSLKKYQFSNNRLMQQGNPTILDFPYGENLSEVIRHNNKLRKECGELFLDYNLKIVFDKDENFTIQKQLDEFTAFQIGFEQVADTLQRLIFHKAAIATNSNTVLLFEEPEAHMFPPYISKFTSDLSNDTNGNQFFITTHSPFVINDLIENIKDEVSIFLLDYKKGETLIHRLTEEETHEAAQFGYDFFLNLKNFMPAE